MVQYPGFFFFVHPGKDPGQKYFQVFCAASVALVVPDFDNGFPVAEGSFQDLIFFGESGVFLFKPGNPGIFLPDLL